MKIKFKTGIAGPNFSYAPGDVVDLKQEQAIKFCKSNVAYPIKEKITENQKYPKHIGGGWYELSDGEKTQGKEEAVKQQNKLKGG